MVEHTTYKGFRTYLSKIKEAEAVPVDYIVQWMCKDPRYDPNEIKRIMVQMIKEWKSGESRQASRSSEGQTPKL